MGKKKSITSFWCLLPLPVLGIMKNNLLPLFGGGAGGFLICPSLLGTTFKQAGE